MQDQRSHSVPQQRLASPAPCNRPSHCLYTEVNTEANGFRAAPGAAILGAIASLM